MNTKKRLKSGMRLSKLIAGNNINFTKKIADKYCIGNLKSQFANLIFRQYKRMLAGENHKTEIENNTIINNHSKHVNYINTNKFTLKYLTQTIYQDNIKNNKEMPVPFNILKATQLNSYNKVQSNTVYNYSQPDLFYKRQQDVIKDGSRENSLGYTSVADMPTVINLSKRLSDKYIKTVTQNVTGNVIKNLYQNVSQSASFYINKLYKDKTKNPDLVVSHQRQRYGKAGNKTDLKVSTEMRSLWKTSSVNRQLGVLGESNLLKRQSKLIHGESSEHDLHIMTLKFTKQDTLRQQSPNDSVSDRSSNDIVKNTFTYRSPSSATEESHQAEPKQISNEKGLNKTILRGSDPKQLLLQTHNIKKQLEISGTGVQLKNNKQLSSFINSQRQQRVTHVKGIDRELQVLTDENTEDASFEEQPLQNRISDRINKIVEKNTISNRRPGIPTKKNIEAQNVNRDQNNLRVFRSDQNTKIEKVPEAEQETHNQGEILLRTTTGKTTVKKDFTPTTHGFIKSALVQADGAITKIIKGLSQKKNDEKGLKNNVYQNGTELIPAALKNDRQSETTSKGKQNLENLFEKKEDNNLTLFKPRKSDTVIENRQANKDEITVNKEAYEKIVSLSKPRKSSISDIEIEEVNLLAEKIYKILEKRIAIQKDRRGLR